MNLALRLRDCVCAGVAIACLLMARSPVTAQTTVMSMPNLAILDEGVVSDTITVLSPEIIDNLTVTIELDHPLLPHVGIFLTSPSGTTVTLFLRDTPAGCHTLPCFQNMHLEFSDNGAAFGTNSGGPHPWDCGTGTPSCAMQPRGPGQLATFDDENAAGDWVLTIEDCCQSAADAAANLLSGTLVKWSLTFDGCGAAAAPTPVSGFQCTDPVVVAGNYSTTLTWIARGYESFEILRDGTSIGMVSGATTFDDTAVPPGSHRYQIVATDLDTGCTSVAYCTVTGSQSTMVEAGVAFDAPATPTSTNLLINGAVFTTLDVMDPREVVAVDVTVDITPCSRGMAGCTGTPAPALTPNLTLTLESPAGVLVDLSAMTTPVPTNVSGSAIGLLTRFSDTGESYASGSSLAFGTRMQPAGPGTMASLLGLGNSAAGSWTLHISDDETVADADGEDGAILLDWSLRFYQEAPSSAEFIRGDCVPSDNLDTNDIIYLVSLVFNLPGTTPSPCEEACNVVIDGQLDTSDIIFLVSTVFALPGTDPIPPPHPACGPAPLPPLGCSSFEDIAGNPVCP